MSLYDKYLAVEDAVASVRAAISALGSSRELSLALTNLQQSEMWVREHSRVQAQKAPDAE